MRAAGRPNSTNGRAIRSNVLNDIRLYVTGRSTVRTMQIRDLITRIRTRSPGHTVSGRLVDIHMWTIRDGWTSRAQAFRDETGRAFALLTLRVGDRGPSHINGAEAFRKEARAQFFPDERSPPILIVNVLNPHLKLEDSPQIQTLDFDAHGIFDYHYATDPSDIQTLNGLGAEWEGAPSSCPTLRRHPSTPTSGADSQSRTSHNATSSTT